MKTAESVARRKEFQRYIAAQMRAGNVFSLRDIILMAKESKISHSVASSLVAHIEAEQFFVVTGVRAKRIPLGYGHALIFDADADPQKTNMRSKLQSMLINEKGEPVRSWLREKIQQVAVTHNISGVAPIH